MPIIRLETNVKQSAILNLDALMTQLSGTIAKVLGKPESYVNIIVVPDVAMIFGGSPDPCGCVNVISIGKLGVDENIIIAKEIYPILEEHLGIKGDRCYIKFEDVDRANIGYNGTTFHGLLKK